VLDIRKIKVISFDLDNTLYDNQPVIKLAEKISQEYLMSEFKKQNKEFNVELLVETRKKLFKHKNVAYDNLTFLRQECLRHVCAALSNSESIVQRATEIFIELRQQASIPEEIVSMIKRLSKGYTLVSITNGNCDANNLVIGQYFDKNYSPQQGYRAKPHMAMYQKVMEDYQITPQQLLHVGDEEKTDGLGAGNTGCQFYLLKPFASSEGFNNIIKDFLLFLT